MNKEIEVWKSLDFLGYPDYEVSTFGRVKSLPRNTTKGKILKPWKNNKGYLYINLYKNAKGKTFPIHRLVCLAFLENPLNLPCVNHKDENPSNNHVVNLEWCTYQYNNCYGTLKERKSKIMKGKILGENNPMYGKHHSDKHKSKISEANKGKPKSEEFKLKIRKPILQYTKENVFIREWDSAIIASKELNIHNGSISWCCKGKLKTAGGFIWKFKE